MKIQLIYSYDGSKFQGSQTQPHENGVEDELARALAHVGIFERVISSSRTDKSVHANNQSSSVVCGDHFKDLNRLQDLINHHAHPSIHIKRINLVDDSFQARYDAVARSYRYEKGMVYVGTFGVLFGYFTLIMLFSSKPALAIPLIFFVFLLAGVLLYRAKITRRY